MGNILIAGCGYVGGALAEKLTAAGDAVWGLRRRPPVDATAYRPIAADLTQPDSLRHWPAAFDAVVYAVSAEAQTEAAYQAAYVDGLRNLIGALAGAEQKPARLVFVSSTGVYAQDNGETVDEDSPAENDRFSGRMLRAGEALALDAPLPGVVLRLAGIYGPGRTRVIDAVRDGTARIDSKDHRILNHIHRDDCAGAIAHLLRLPAPAPLYLGVDHEPAPRSEAFRWIAARLGLPEPPEAPARNDAPAPVRGGWRYYRNDRLVGSGYRFQHPTYREGYAALMR